MREWHTVVPGRFIVSLGRHKRVTGQTTRHVCEKLPFELMKNDHV